MRVSNISKIFHFCRKTFNPGDETDIQPISNEERFPLFFLPLNKMASKVYSIKYLLWKFFLILTVINR